MSTTESGELTSGTLRREVSAFLRAADEPDALTFKQVRLAVEKSLSLPEGALKDKGYKSKIKDAVHSVMDDIDGEANTRNGEDEERDEEQVEDGGPVPRVRTLDGGKGHSNSGDDDDSKNNSKSNSGSKKKRDKDGAGSSRDDRHSSSAARRRKYAGSDSDGGDSDNGDEIDKGKRGSSPRDRNAAVASGVTKKRTADGVKKEDGSRNSTAGDRGRSGEKEKKTLVCVLSEAELKRRQVNVQTWKGHLQVHIREHYLHPKTQEFAPTTKGISLNPTQWNALKNAAQDVDQLLRQKMT